MHQPLTSTKQSDSRTNSMPVTSERERGVPRRIQDAATTTGGPVLLVVDDDPFVAEMLRDALINWGFSVFVAKNGQEGLDVLAREKVDGILLDLNMPVMDGMTMLDELRWLGYPMPVVIMSGGVKRPGLGQLEMEGAQGFMSKPFSLSFLRDVCSTVFENQGVTVSPDHDSQPTGS